MHPERAQLRPFPDLFSLSAIRLLPQSLRARFRVSDKSKKTTTKKNEKRAKRESNVANGQARLFFPPRYRDSVIGKKRMTVDTHEWYCACRKLNSSLILSHDSATVNLNGWLGCGGPCGQKKNVRKPSRHVSISGCDTYQSTRVPETSADRSRSRRISLPPVSNN